ncbi:MAG TPA: YHYH protein [Acidimicrobiales bacterium]|nr:YHYH protein [Acidimicrobiales bacterium]
MRHRLVGILLALTLVVAAACGDDDGGGDTAEDTTTTTAVLTDQGGATTTTAAPPAGEDVVLADGRTTIPAQNVGDVDLTRLPVGDDLIADGPTAGELFLCEGFGDPNAGGAQAQGPWFNGDGTFDFTAKVFVQGEVDWPEAEFATTVEGEERRLTGNNLPVDHTTGEFPIADDNPAAEFDQNPSGIVAAEFDLTVPANPTEQAEPQCVAGEVGFLLSGVILNSPVDARAFDAVAWESQDHCVGHPNQAGYHYHSISPCVPDDGTGHSELVGYAFDGFGIYGHRGEDGAVMTNDDLDECHGHAHEVEWDGETVELYHYHATWEFPYAVGCFKGENAQQGPPFAPAGPLPGG